MENIEIMINQLLLAFGIGMFLVLAAILIISGIVKIVCMLMQKYPKIAMIIGCCILVGCGISCRDDIVTIINIIIRQQ